ncbi:MAG: ABC transporter substrate-binding protein [Chitinophagia bacterium]|jgi:iron complex transport system substrate-binding protein
MKNNISSTILLLGLIIFTGCQSSGSNQKKDSDKPRIVCLSKHLTEMIFALGKGSLLIGRDLTSNYPDSTQFITQVGYHRALNTEGILSLNPSVVIHSNDIGPAQVEQQLKEAGTKVSIFPQANSPDSSRIVLKLLAEYLGAQSAADSIIHKMDSVTLIQKQLQKKCIDTPTVMVVQYGQASNRFFILSGRKGAADYMIQEAVAKVALYDGKGSRDLSAEAIAKANPAIILATDVGFDKLGSVEAFAQLPGIALTDAYKTKRIYRVMEHDIVYFGPRTPSNIIHLIHQLHPKLHD